MPAIVTCPHCNVTLKPKTPLPAGARVKCPKCQTPFVVPGDEAPPLSAAPKPGPKSGVAKPAAPRPKPAPPPEEEPVEDAEGVTEAADDAPVEEGEAPVKAKKKIPLWMWLAGSAAALFLLCGCCGVGSWVGSMYLLGGGNVSVTTYSQLKKGMTEDEVKKVMGGAPTKTTSVGGMKTESWTSGPDFITVTFDGKGAANNRVIHTESSALKMDAQGF